jgi:asparagine synthase (glutamine-hydrolysing)
MLNLLRVSKATIPFAIPHLMQYLSILREKYGDKLIYFNGNGGDRIMGEIVPRNKKYLRTNDSLIQYILEFDGPDLTSLGLDTAVKLTGIDKKDFMVELENLLNSYPEKSVTDKFIHYNIFGQSLNWHHFGDNRKKSFFWNTSPFWSTDFMFYAMNCPLSQKKYMYLYTNFLNEINSSLLKVPYANNRQKTPTSIDKNRHFIYHYLTVVKSMPNPVRFVWKRIKKCYGNQPVKETTRQVPAILNCVSAQMNTCQAVRQYLNPDELNSILKKSENIKKRTFASIFTITSLLEFFSENKSSIEKYKEEYFDCYE